MDGLALILLLIVASVTLIMLFRRISLPPILAYLIVGVVIGPNAMALISSTETLALVAEFGIAFLLFSIGLEFSLPQMVSMRRTVFGMGALQYFGTGVIIVGILVALKTDLNQIIVFALALGMSSTAVVIKQLSEQGELHSRHGNIALGVLLFQDMVAVPGLIIVAALENTSDFTEVSSIFIKGFAAIATMILIGRFVLPKLLEEIAKAYSKELFTLAILMIIISAAFTTHWLGLPIALGSFIAGMLLGDSQYRHRIEADIRPFKDVLLGFFFITIGMLVNPQTFANHAPFIIASAAALMLIKGCVVWLATLLMRYPSWVSFRSALVLGHVGEFGFAIISLALSLAIIPIQQAELAIAIAITTLFVAPILVLKNKCLAARLPRYQQDNLKMSNDVQLAAHTYNNHVVIFGFGRVGQTLSQLLRSKNMEYIALDMDPARILVATQGGEPVFYGNAADLELMEALQLKNARMAAVTFNNRANTLKALQHIQAIRPDLPIIVRADSDELNKEYREAGASEVILDPLETGLSFGAHAMLMGGTEPAEVLRTTRQVRVNHYAFLGAFFQGTEEKNAVRPIKIMQSLSLDAHSPMLHKHISDLPTIEHGIKLVAVRRNDNRYESLNDSFVLKELDTLIVSGSPRDIEQFYKEIS